jgi:non-heme chloroperoxidase
VDTGPHAGISTRLDHFCDEATFVDWGQDSLHLPDWQASWRHLTAGGQVAALTPPVGRKPDPRVPATGRTCCNWELNGRAARRGVGVTTAIRQLLAGQLGTSRSLQRHHRRRNPMGIVTTRDGTEIFYKDWGTGQPVVFSHGWPLTADAWDDQLFFVASNGYRAIAHDRRGGGRSGQPWDGNDLDTYADDLAALLDALDLRDVVLVGHSTGGGEVVRYVGRHGTSRVAKVLTVGAIPPLMLKTAANPGGLPIEVFDGLRAGVTADRSQFYKDLSEPFYGANRPGNTVSQGLRDSFWLLSMTVGEKGAYDCIKAFSETDLTEDLKKIDVPMLIIHGDDDQIVPIADSALLSSKIVKDATLKVYPGAPHGLAQTTAYKDTFNTDLLNFIKS